MLAVGSIDSSWLHHLNWVDYLFLVIVVYNIITGAWVGFMAQCVTIGGILVGVVVAGQVFHDFGLLLGHLGLPKDARDWGGYVAAFAIIFALFLAFSVLARNISRLMVRDTVNKLAGVVLGALSGTLICLFMVTAVSYFHIGRIYTPMTQAQLPHKTTSWLGEFVTLLPNKMQYIQDCFPESDWATAQLPPNCAEIGH
ncbi:MAG TPA: CvpA family protein [Chloroflexota bacterium]|nr:CvpA family protein [Chloroflexota bacterium]